MFKVSSCWNSPWTYENQILHILSVYTMLPTTVQAVERHAACRVNQHVTGHSTSCDHLTAKWRQNARDFRDGLKIKSLSYTMANAFWDRYAAPRIQLFLNAGSGQLCWLKRYFPVPLRSESVRKRSTGLKDDIHHRGRVCYSTLMELIRNWPN